MVEERVQKIIANSGYCSRRKAEELIQDGKVMVNNKKITIGDKADADKDNISISGQEIKKEKKVYYMLNKPKDYITTTDDLYDRKKVTDLIPSKQRIYPVGRLDRDAQGILILTNDGDFANKVMHPSNNVSKTYVVLLDRPFKKEDVIKLKKGIRIDKTFVKSKVRILEENKVEITVHVGVHKVVKRLFKSLDYYVKKLKRTKIGDLKLDIPIKSYRELTKEDFKKILGE